MEVDGRAVESQGSNPLTSKWLVFKDLN